jgi:hypothetical protein
LAFLLHYWKADISFRDGAKDDFTVKTRKFPEVDLRRAWRAGGIRRRITGSGVATSLLPTIVIEFSRNGYADDFSIARRSFLRRSSGGVSWLSLSIVWFRFVALSVMAIPRNRWKKR